MAGYVRIKDRTLEFHVGGFPNVNYNDVEWIQLDCDELAYGLSIWPGADKFAAAGRVRKWDGVRGKFFAHKFLQDNTLRCADESTGYVCRKRRARIIVEVDLDPVPGWGNDPEDYATLIRNQLADSIPHYHPSVTVES